MKNSDRTIYIDFDGVLAKWDYVSQEVWNSDWYYADRPVEIVMRNSLIILHDTYGINAEGLSAAASIQAAAAKGVWVDNEFWQKGLPWFRYHIVPYGKKKEDYVRNAGNSLLIDDFHENLLSWPGIPVKFYNGINGRGGHIYQHSLFKEWDAETIARRIYEIYIAE